MSRPKKKKVKSFRGSIAHGSVWRTDAKTLLSTISSDTVDLIFLDPPFNLGKQYARTRKLDSRPDDEYEAWFRAVLDEACRVLRPGGSLFLYHIPIRAMTFGNYLAKQLEFRHWIAVSMKNGFVRGQRLYPAHYALLYFTKGHPTFFRRPKLKPSRCRHCGELIKDYGGYWPIVRQKGLNLSDIWDDLSPVRHSNTKNRPQNELPLTLLERVVKIGGRAGRLFVDPFAGSGVGVVAAIAARMHFVAGDIYQMNADLVVSRIVKAIAMIKRENPNA